MEKFTSLEDARTFVARTVDVPVLSSIEDVKQGLRLTKSSIELDNGAFTNSYDLTFNGDSQQPEIIAFDALQSTYNFISSTTQFAAASSGGFFYLADQSSSLPRQLALNLCISQGDLRSLPVSDRESVVASHSHLEVRLLTALGSLSVNGHELDWSGSNTDYDTELKVYSNGNAVITHQEDPITGSIRILDESSRYTPSFEDDDLIDVGFIGRGGNNFIGVEGSTSGELDIFAHDFVLRSPLKYIEGNSELEVHTIGGIALSRFDGGAFSAGPGLNIADFRNHAVNRDLSLGTRPPFCDTPMARTILYKSEDGLTHLRLFDGRPGSETFPGIKPEETVSLILSEGAIEWGCFLDPGQTAKLCINEKRGVSSYGNRHYLRWPNENDPCFVWAPDVGRPVANVIAL